MLQRPAATEYSTFFAPYMERVTSDDLFHELDMSCKQTVATLEGLTDEQANFRYAPGKWSIKEIVGHLNDAERIISYRALRIARGDTTALAGFDEEAYVSQADFSERTLQSLLEDFHIARQSTISMLVRFPAYAWSRVGIVSNNEITVRALGFIIAGHVHHHHHVIMERYISALH